MATPRGKYEHLVVAVELTSRPEGIQTWIHNMMMDSRYMLVAVTPNNYYIFRKFIPPVREPKPPKLKVPK